MVGLLRRYSNFGDEVKQLESLVDLPVNVDPDPPTRVTKLRVYLTEADEQHLVQSYCQGSTIRQLAAEFGINREKVSLILQRHGAPTRYHQTTRVDLDRAAELEADGLTLTAIAEAMGIGRTTLVRARRQAQ
jgi:transposase-like protein